MRVIAMLDRSTGNAEVGEMWIETASFVAETPIGEIVKWAQRHERDGYKSPQLGNLRIQIDNGTT